MLDNGPLHDSGQDWCDGDGPKVSMLCGGRNFGYRSNAGLFPLLRDCGCGDGQVEKPSNWFVEGWGSQPDEPDRNSVKSGGYGMEVVKYLEYPPF